MSTQASNTSVTPNVLSEETIASIEHWLAKYPEDRRQSALLPALDAAQHQNGGWLTEELMNAVAAYLGVPRVLAYEVANFYSMFSLEKTGRHKINVCTNISCMLCGADVIVAHLEKKLGIKLGDTTADGKITLTLEEECLAACSSGPMMTVDGHYHENLTPEKVDAILDGLD